MEVREALQEVQDKGNELQTAFKALIPAFEEGDGEKRGISLLHAKYATLMRYNLSLVRMIQARVRGTDTTALADKLVEDWVALSKIRPIEKKLKYQIDSMLKTLAKGDLSSRPDDERHRPNLNAFVFSDEEEKENDDEEEDIYRPPRIAEVVYDGNDEKRKLKEEKEREKYQARKVRSEGVRDMINDIKGRPEEIREDERDGTKSKALQRLMREDEERRNFEEEHFIRLNLTKEDKKRRREIERAADGPIGDGEADFDGLEAVADRVLSSKGSKGTRNKSRGSVRRNEMEEQYKVQQLDRITEQMNGGPRKSSGKSKKKRRRR